MDNSNKTPHSSDLVLCKSLLVFKLSHCWIHEGRHVCAPFLVQFFVSLSCNFLIGWHPLLLGLASPTLSGKCWIRHCKLSKILLFLHENLRSVPCACVYCGGSRICQMGRGRVSTHCLAKFSTWTAWQTRMHFSGMITARLLTVFHHALWQGGVPAWGCTYWGMYLSRGVYVPKGCTYPGDTCQWGVRAGAIPAQVLPSCGQTDTLKLHDDQRYLVNGGVPSAPSFGCVTD